ncbi:MAG: rhodanese-like domain-containing protein [Candidatus Binataceae bacterium]
MAHLVSTAWVGDRLGQRGIVIADPRRPMKYLSGHLPGAINIPVYRAFGADGSLLAPDELAAMIGGAGLGNEVTPVIYDSPDGQNAAMLAWILEYLGRGDAHVMDAFYEQWKAEGREVLYRPVAAKPASFSFREDASIRVSMTEVRAASGAQLIDFRSREEFSGERDTDNYPGHIPGAVNVVWRDLASPPSALLKPADEIGRMLEVAGIHANKPVIAYCRSGPRAALGYLALKHLGYDVRLFDGSWAQWARAGLPAET